MFTNRKTRIEDIANIKANKFLKEEEKTILVDAWGFYKAETLLNNDEIVAIATFREFHPRLYNSGIIIKDNITITELKKVKAFVKYVISSHNADYVYSEGATCPVRDRFHEFLGFEIEKDLDTFKKWKFKGLLY
jgi:ATP-dependent RNA circularization protein (DNA/RNA ligase family)